MTSEIRTNSITSRAGMSTVTMTDSGPMFSGITTFVDNSGFTFGVGGGTSIFTPATNVLTFGTNNTEKIRIDASGHMHGVGVITATHFYGDGSGLTGISGVSVANQADNRLITATGTTDALNGEANLLFDGGTLALNGRYQRGSATVQDGDAIAGGININGTDMDASVIMSVFGNDNDFTRISGSKSRNASVGGHTIVQNNDVLLSLKGFGSDGTNFEEAAQIEIQVDGTPGNNVMPGRIVFKTATTDGVAERLRIKSTGELIVGTPNLINTSPSKFQVAANDATGSAIFARFNASVYSSYLDFYKSRSNTIGTAYVVNDGDHLGSLRFYGADGSNSGYTTAAEIYGSCDGGSGAAGDMPGRITFHTRPDGAGQSMQERLRITSGGQMGLGTNNPSNLFHIKDTGNSSIMRLESNSYSSYVAQIQSNNNVGNGSEAGNLYLRGQSGVQMSGNGGTATQFDLDGTALTLTGTTDGVLNLDTSDTRGSFIRFKQGGATEAWVGCGQGLSLGGKTTLALRSDADIRIRTGSEEHATITTEGYLAVKGQAGNWIYGNHPANYTFHQLSSSKNGDWMMQLRQEHHNGLGFVMRVANNGNNEAIALYRENVSTYGFKVYQNGNVQNSNNSYGQLSDITLKENITDSNSQWDDIKNIKVRNYNFKDDPDKVNMIGVVAQEIETVSPKLVWEDKEGLKGVAYSVLYMKAIKALQEAQARIEILESKVETLEQENIALRARVTNLEGN